MEVNLHPSPPGLLSLAIIHYDRNEAYDLS